VPGGGRVRNIRVGPRLDLDLDLGRFTNRAKVPDLMVGLSRVVIDYTGLEIGSPNIGVADALLLDSDVGGFLDPIVDMGNSLGDDVFVLPEQLSPPSGISRFLSPIGKVLDRISSIKNSVIPAVTAVSTLLMGTAMTGGEVPDLSALAILLAPFATMASLSSVAYTASSRPGSSKMLQRPSHVDDYEFPKENIEYATEICNELLAGADQLIREGKTPILILPDTSMRVAGHLFHSAFVTAFPDVYKPLKRYRMQATLYIFTRKAALDERKEFEHTVILPDVIGKIDNPHVIVVDTSDTGGTRDDIQMEFERRFADIPVDFFRVKEGRLNIKGGNPRLGIIEKKMADYSNGIAVYLGSGGVFKFAYPLSTKVSHEDIPPNQLRISESQFSVRFGNVDQEIAFWREPELKRVFSRLGRSLGKDFRSQRSE